MLAGFARIVAAVVVCSIFGAVIGLFMGAMAENFPLWMGVSALVGAAFGVAIGYGLLPER